MLQPKLALFSVSAVGNHLSHQISNKRILGSIVLDEISMVSIVFIAEDVHFLCGSSVVASISTSFSVHLSRVWVRILEVA